MDVFDQLESQVRSYSRAFPAIFARSQGALLFDERGERFIDFLSGAGSLNYGHNHPALKRALLRYLQDDGLAHGLDLATTAKRRFLERFRDVILVPREMDYKIQFTGPTGANGVEAALKLARSVKQRANVIAFSGAYHGHSAGALAVTANSFYRNEFFFARSNVAFLPFDGYVEGRDSLPYIRKALMDSASGVDRPAAAILETVQAEGGVNVASSRWLREIEAICRELDILLIVDDIQAGNGRTGSYFSFEPSGIRPDMVVLSKSISGYGLPMTILLLRPELDRWKPGEHTGTFRGNNLAFVTAAEALSFWEDQALAEQVLQKGRRVEALLGAMASKTAAQVRGRGLIWGLELPESETARDVAREAFRNGLILERCGARENVLKILPPLTIEQELLEEGLAILGDALTHCLSRRASGVAAG